MKKVVTGLCVVALALIFVGVSMAQDSVTEKSKTKVTSSGKTITKETGTLKTPVGDAKVKTKEVTKGNLTETKTKADIKLGKAGHKEKIQAKIIQYNENDPKNLNDDTVTFLKLDGTKITGKIQPHMANQARSFHEKQVWVSTYAITPEEMLKDAAAQAQQQYTHMIEDIQPVE